MRILLIKLKHIGDSLILTPTITAIKKAYPEAKIWVVVRRGCEGILAGCPDIARIFTLAGVEKNDRRPGDLWRQIQVLLQLWSVRFDYVFELGDGHRGRLFAMLCRTRRLYSVKPGSPLKPFEQRRFNGLSAYDWQTCHRVEKDFYSVSEFLPLPEPIPPLSFESKFAKLWEPGRALTDFSVVQIGSRQGFNVWSRENWRELCRMLLARFDNIVISCGPVAREIEEAAWLQQELGPRVLSTHGKASWAEVAWLLYRAKLLVTPSTGAMHLAAACHCPTVALFGPTIEDHWHPWQVPYRIVTSPGYVWVDKLNERFARMRIRKMDEIQVRDVMAACEDLLGEGLTK